MDLLTQFVCISVSLVRLRLGVVLAPFFWQTTSNQSPLWLSGTCGWLMGPPVFSCMRRNQWVCCSVHSCGLCDKGTISGNSGWGPDWTCWDNKGWKSEFTELYLLPQSLVRSMLYGGFSCGALWKLIAMENHLYVISSLKTYVFKDKHNYQSLSSSSDSKHVQISQKGYAPFVLSFAAAFDAHFLLWSLKLNLGQLRHWLSQDKPLHLAAVLIELTTMQKLFCPSQPLEFFLPWPNSILRSLVSLDHCQMKSICPVPIWIATC